jgi:putative oxidoreductase
MIQKMLTPFAELSYALLRIVVGLMFSFHGMQKIFHIYMPPEHIPQPGTQMWFGGLIELVCGLMIAFGFFASPAAFLASGTMAVAYIQFHWNFQFDSNFLPGVNKGELALLYSFLFLFIACKGAGMLSIDASMAKKNDQPAS